MVKKIQFTKEGYENVKKEHADLTAKRAGAVQELSTARDMGDRSENAAYKSARWKLSSIDKRLRHLKNLIKYGEVVEKEFNGKADIGTKVTLSDGKDTFKYTLVGGFESDIANGKLSINSPIGKALLGKKAGETIIVNIPGGMATYKIIAVST